MIFFALGILAGLCIGASTVVGVAAFCVANRKQPEQLIAPTEAEIQRSWDLAMADYLGGEDE